MLTKPLDQNRYRMLNIQLEQFDSRASRAVVEFRSTAYCLPLTAYRLLLTAYRLLLTAYCLLLTARRHQSPLTSHNKDGPFLPASCGQASSADRRSDVST